MDDALFCVKDTLYFLCTKVHQDRKQLNLSVWNLRVSSLKKNFNEANLKKKSEQTLNSHEQEQQQNPP